MERNIPEFDTMARAYPVSDARQRLRPVPAKSVQGLPPPQGQRGLKKRALNIGTLNVGSMTGRGRELADLMVRRNIGVLCVQETRWKGNKARELGESCKLIYSGANEKGRNGVGIILNSVCREQLVRVNRRNDRIISVGLDSGGIAINIVCAYAPQVGCDEQEKQEFWEALDQELSEIPSQERCFIGGDLNGHVGSDRGTVERVHGGWGIGDRNAEGESIVDFAVAWDMAVVNTFFKKNENQYATYKSGRSESQIDYVLCRRTHLGEVKNCKVVKSESVTSQHRPVIVEFNMKMRGKGKQELVQKIKWWKLRGEEIVNRFKSEVMGNVILGDNANDWWEVNSKVILAAGEKVLGKTSGKGPPGDKETWWWNEDVQKKVKIKKEAKKKYDTSQREEDKEEYKRVKKQAKSAVAVAKARASATLYEELETSDGAKRIYSIAKARDKATKDFTHVRQIKDAEGVVLRSDEDIRKQWETYFRTLLNEVNQKKDMGCGIPNQNVTPGIMRQEVHEAIKKMKNGKAVGPDGIPVEAWKALGEDGIDLLWDLVNKIEEEEMIPEAWRDSVLIPIYKDKGDIQECKNYRGIKLVSHSMKIWERIIERRLRVETSIGEEQFGFMHGRGTTDAIFALRQLMEKYGERQKDLHLVFIDLEKAYDTVPREEIWRCLREKGIPEKYVRLVKDMYERSHTQVRCSVGVTERFPVTVGLHQGSVLSPYLFNLVMDVLTEKVREPAPWTMLFADDIVLVEEEKEIVQAKLERWRSAVEDGGLKISRMKTEYMWFRGEGNIGDMELLGERLGRVGRFKYLGSHLCDNGDLDEEIIHRIQAGWRNWKRVSGVLCDQRISRGLKGKVYKTMVRTAMIYGSETWPIKKVHEKKMDVAEMRMLRWMFGKTRRDKIRNERIREMARVTEVSKKVQERRLRWYGHVMRRDEEYVGRRMCDLQVEGKRRRGRPNKRWRDCISEDLREKGLTAEETQDRNEWRQRIRNSDP